MADSLMPPESIYDLLDRISTLNAENMRQDLTIHNLDEELRDKKSTIQTALVWVAAMASEGNLPGGGLAEWHKGRVIVEKALRSALEGSWKS